MSKTIWISLAVCLSLFPFFSAESNSWSSLAKIEPGKKIEVVKMDSTSIKGEFSDYDDESISLIKKGKIVICARKDVKTVGLQGASKRKKHVLMGMAIGAGAGFLLGLSTTSNDDSGFEFISDQTVMTALALMGAGAGAGIGAALPAHTYGLIYAAGDRP